MPTDAQLTVVQRQAAIESVGENVALRSGAGCGKTFVLARRFLELLRRAASDADADRADQAISRFVALTFTNKAALEMSTRVRAMLDERARAAEGDERARILAWLDQIPEARIHTIDGFCSSLLRSHAVEAGVDPSFSVCADDLLASRLLGEATEQAVLDAVEAQRTDVADLLGDMNFDNVVALVRQLMVGRGGTNLETLTDPKALMESWRQIIETHRPIWLAGLGEPKIREMFDQLDAIACDDPNDKLAVIRQEQLDAVGAILDNPSSATTEMFARLSDRTGNVGTASAWGSKDIAKEVRARIKELAQTVAEYAEFCEDLGPADERAAAGLATLAQLAREAERLYKAEKRSRGMLDFADLLAGAHRLLAGSAELRASIAAGIDQLLIDECQDTNRFQLETLAMLIGGGTPEKAPPTGKLFAVGDAKQSIYRFRGAQVEVFSSMCKRLGENQQKYLDESFRTHEAGVAFVNDLFAPLMGDDFSPTEAHRKQCPPAPSVEVILAAGAQDEHGQETPITRAAEAAEAQAQATAHRIREMLDAGERLVWDADTETWRPVRAGDIAILFARMTNSLAYERALQQRDIPYYVVAGMGFFQRQEVFDVLTALSAVDNPRDDIALMGMLRGGLVALSDNALMHIALACEGPYWPALLELRRRQPTQPVLAGKLSPGEARTLTETIDLLARLHLIKDAIAIDELLQQLLDATGYEAALLSQFQGRRMLSNVRQVLQRAAAASADHLALADFVAEMRGLIANESRYEQAAVAGEHENVVRLMTIHKAKGLEFPVVILPDLNAGKHSRGARLLVRDDWGPTFNRPTRLDEEDDDTSDKPLSYRLAARAENADDQAEDLRKLYVAVTRHEDHLILLGADYRNRDGSLRDSDSYLSKINGVLGVTEALEVSGQSEDQGQDAPATIPYADGQFRAAVRRLSAAPADGRGANPSAGRKLLQAANDADELAKRITQAAKGPGKLPLIGPLPESVGQVEIAVTALNDFGACPMLYRWRHELRLPRRYESLVRGTTPSHDAKAKPQASAFDAATVGTLYHKCMELLDVRNPQDATTLVNSAAAACDIEPSPAIDTLAKEFEPMLAAFAKHDLAAELRNARDIRRELDFALECPPAIVRGQIDLLYQDAAGLWHVVDYKSDNVSAPDEIADHAARYQLQLALYAKAAGLHLGQPVADASLYFLRPAATAPVPVDPAALATAVATTSDLARNLIAARRTNRFERQPGQLCQWCSYKGLCK